MHKNSTNLKINPITNYSKDDFLLNITNSIKSPYDLNNLVYSICTELIKIFSVEKIVIASLNRNIELDLFVEVDRNDINIPSMKPLFTAESRADHIEYFSCKGNDTLIIEDSIGVVNENSFYFVNPLLVGSGLKTILTKVIKIDEENIYAISFLSFASKKSWSDQEIEILKALNDLLYITIKQAESYQSLLKRANRETLIRKTLDAIRTSLDLNELFEKVCIYCAEALNVQRVSLVEFPDPQNYFDVKIWHEQKKPEYLGVLDTPESDLLQEHKRLACAFWAISLFEDKKFAFNDVQKADVPEFFKNYYKYIGVKSIIGIPIKNDENKWGSIVLAEYDSYREWTEADYELLETIASQIYVAIKQAQLYTEINKQAQRAKLSQNITHAIRSSLDLNVIKQNIVEEIANLITADRVCILEFDDSTRKFKPLDEFSVYTKTDSIHNMLGYSYSDIPEYKVVQQLHEQDFDLIYSNLDKFLDDLQVRGTGMETFARNTGIKALASISIVHDGQLLGALSIQFTREYDFSQDEVNFVKSLASQMGIALYQAKLYNKVHQAAIVKNEFISNMSHELKTPLNSVIGFADLILSESENLTSKQKKYLSNISKSGSHLLGIINDLLELSELESGSLDLTYEMFNSSIVITDVIGSLKQSAIQKNIKINSDIKDIYVNADKNKFRQIVYNILNNAIKYTFEFGSIQITSNFANNEIVISVEDTGIGIANEDFEKIFNEFELFDSAYTKQYEGTGLGLSLTKKLIEIQGGSISFESVLGKGSKFWFNLPNASLCGNL